MSRKLLYVAVLVLLFSLMVACAGGEDQTSEPTGETEEPGTAEVTGEPVEPTTEAEATGEATAEGTGEVGPNVPVSEIEERLIYTTGMHVVGIGEYVAAERYAVAAGADPAAQPAHGFILPYAIHPNMHIADLGEFEPPAALEGTEDMTFEWALEAPEGSSAELLVNDTVAVFQADVEGEYTLTLNVTDAAGNAAEAVTWAIHATTYVGSGYLNVDDATPPQCAACHEEQAVAWAETGHASMFARGINGELGEHYNANCITCHTTGFNNRDGAENNGFDDVAADAGWEFPGTLQEGNWEQMQEDFPEVAAMANIQCESCHGPGAEHNGDEEWINRGLSYATCAQCHAEDPYHVKPQQWELSPHAQKTARAFWYPIGESRTACVGCHTGGGFIDMVNGVPVEERRTEYQTITCAVCHDPHNAKNPNQLRVFDTVTLPNGAAVEGAGPAATCMTCHNTRVDPVASVEADPSEIMQGDQGTGTFQIGLPHYSSAAELMNTDLANAGYTWGIAGDDMRSTPHGSAIEGTCVTCHMAETPGMDDAGTADDSSDDTPLPGNNTVGDHTFLMTSPVDETENLGVCQQCHTEATSFEEIAAEEDYDGDGEAEAYHAELEGLLELMKAELEGQGVAFLESRPYYALPADSSVEMRGAVFNYHLIFEAVHRGSQFHNPQYLVALAQLSYRKVAGEDVPNAEIIAPEG